MYLWGSSGEDRTAPCSILKWKKGTSFQSGYNQHLRAEKLLPQMPCADDLYSFCVIEEDLCHYYTIVNCLCCTTHSKLSQPASTTYCSSGDNMMYIHRSTVPGSTCSLFSKSQIKSLSGLTLTFTVSHYLGQPASTTNHTSPSTLTSKGVGKLTNMHKITDSGK